MICPSCGYENFARNATNCDLCHAELNPKGKAKAEAAAPATEAAPKDTLAQDVAALADAPEAVLATKPKKPRPSAPGKAGEPSPTTALATRLGLPLAGLLALAVFGYLAVLAFQVPNHQLAGHEGVIHHVAVSSDGTRALTAGEDGAVILWNTTDRDALLRIPASEAGATWADFLPGGRALSAGRDGAIREWDLGSGQAVRSIPLENDRGVGAAALAPGGQQLLFATAALGELTVLPLEGEPAPRELGADGVEAIAFSPSGALAACGTGDGEVLVYAMPEGTLSFTLTGHERSVRDLAFSPDGALLASGSHDASIRVWDVATGEPLGEPLVSPSRRGVASLAFSRDGEYLVCVFVDGLVSIFDARTRRLVGRHKLEQRTVHPPGELTFLPTGTFLLAHGKVVSFHPVSGLIR